MSFIADPFEAGSDVAGRERRLHMLAYDYWEGLRADRILPDFRDLTPDGLQPFRDSSLLIDVSDASLADGGQGSVRFSGAEIASLVAEGEVTRGMAMDSLALSDFGRELMAYLAGHRGASKPTEFEYEDQVLAGRGILLPLALGSDDPNFVWIVTSFTANEQSADLAKNTDADKAAPGGTVAPDFTSQLASARRSADEVPHMDVGGRQALYAALASALALYEGAQQDDAHFTEILKAEGIRRQKRAPFTPVLKLVFGKDYEKTRLTEYAAALSYAVRMGQSSADLEAFLADVPGGIKGCVKRERATKGTQTAPAGVPSRADLSSLAALDGPRLATPVSSDLVLLLARRDGDEAVILGEAPMTAPAIERAALSFLEKAGVTSTATDHQAAAPSSSTRNTDSIDQERDAT